MVLKCLGYMHRHEKEPVMTDIIHFVNNETLIASGPIFSKEAFEQYMDKSPNSQDQSFIICYTKNDSQAYIKEKLADHICCSEDHELDRWNALVNQTLK